MYYDNSVYYQVIDQGLRENRRANRVSRGQMGAKAWVNNDFGSAEAPYASMDSIYAAYQDYVDSKAF